MKADLSQVYSDLDLPPECTLEEFRSAYVRRIAELHPDRTGQAPATAEEHAALQRLVSGYTAVTGFHRRYGRMPGAAPRGTGGGLRTVTFAALPPQSTEGTPHGPPDSTDGAEDTRPTWRFVALFIALIVLLASWDWLMLR